MTREKEGSSSGPAAQRGADEAGGRPDGGTVAGAWRPDVDAVTREIAGETLLVPIRGRLADLRQIFSLNPVAAFVWERLDGRTGAAALAAAVAETFEVEPERAEADVAVFLSQLTEAGLASPAGSSA